MVNIKLDFGQRKKSFLIILAIIVYFLSLMLFVFIRYYITKNNIHKEIDLKLYVAAKTLNMILTDDFFNKAIEINSITKDEDYKNIITLSKYCKIINIKYVYSMTMIDNKIYFTSSSATQEELDNKTYTQYFDSYEEATNANKTVFYSNTPLYEESKDKWGYFRSVLIPEKTSRGIRYVIGADYSLNILKSRLLNNLFQSILIGLFFLFIIGSLIGISYYFLKKENKQLQKKAFYDELTQLPNLQKMFQDIVKYNHPVLFLININSFKEINDLFGFDVGDTMLKEIAKRIQFILVSDKYWVYKLLNDEFGIILNDDALSKDNVEVIAKYIFDAVTDYTYIIKNTEINITIYLGIVISKILDFNLTSDNVQNLFAFADMALKLAKQNDKEYIIYDSSLNKSDEFKNNLDWSVKLKDALKKDLFKPFFQSIINNKNKKIEKYECLIRLVENNEIISPYKFIKISKKIKLYSVLTRIMLKKSLEMFKETSYEFSINISAYDIYDKETYSRILFLLEEYKNISKNLVFEILESEGIENYEIIKKFIDEVKKFGCKIAIDDFGTGYSNYEHILKLNVDYIKIDGSLIKNIDKNKNDYLITKSITDFAKALKIKTIAEYVHNEAVYKKVLELGIDYSQGYYFGEPLPSIFNE